MYSREEIPVVYRGAVYRVLVYRGNPNMTPRYIRRPVCSCLICTAFPNMDPNLKHKSTP